GREQAVAMLVVDLVAMTVPLGDSIGAVQLAYQGPLGQHRGVRPQAHGAAQVALTGDDALLVFHRGDDRRRGVRVELRRAGFREAGLGPGVLDDHALQSQAQAQRRDVLLARVADGPDLAFDATDAEPARDAHAVDVAQLGSGALGGGALVGGYPADTYPRVVGEAARAQRLGDRQVRIGQIDVLAHQGDRDFVTWMMHAAQQLVP